jgi:hypothetical protein
VFEGIGDRATANAPPGPSFTSPSLLFLPLDDVASSFIELIEGEHLNPQLSAASEPEARELLDVDLVAAAELTQLPRDHDLARSNR